MRFPFPPLIPIILITAAFTPDASAATLHVPADYPTIQSCIDAATSGQDECVVAPGTYNELINFLGKAITLRSSHGPAVTTIDGTGLNGSVVTCAKGEGPGTIFDGLTVSGGTGTDFAEGLTSGGGMYVSNGSPTIKNCLFTRNRVIYRGAGMYNYLGNPTLENCSFIDNYSSRGYGGGIANWFSNPIIIGCLFVDNFASAGGGLYNYTSNATVEKCKFIRNGAEDGAGIYNDYLSDVSMRRSDFSGNSASHLGGGVFQFYNGSTISNCAFIGNFAEFGGALYNEHTHFFKPTVSNCTLVKNLAVYAGGVINSGSDVILTSCILWGNSSDELVNVFGSTPTISFSAIEGGVVDGAVDGGGNFDLEPGFIRMSNPGPDGWWGGIDDDYGDLRLQPGSPCINAGDPDFMLQPADADLDGHARVLCDRVDMGAYESGIGDFDCNQTINLRDVGGLQTCFTGESQSPYNPGCEALDFEFDGDVDLSDLAQFIHTANP